VISNRRWYSHSPRPFRKWAGLRILASVAKWSKNIHSKFRVCSYHSFKVISVLKPKFGICAKWSLFSGPVTIIGADISMILSTTLCICSCFCVTDGVHLRIYFRATCVRTVCSLHLIISSCVSYTTGILTYMCTVSILKDADLVPLVSWLIFLVSWKIPTYAASVRTYLFCCLQLSVCLHAFTSQALRGYVEASHIWALACFSTRVLQ